MTEAPSETLRTRREDGILEVTLDRPKANAIDLATSRVMGKVFAEFRDDPDLRWRSCGPRETSSSPPAGTSRPRPTATRWTVTTASAGSAGSRSCPTSTSR